MDFIVASQPWADRETESYDTQIKDYGMENKISKAIRKDVLWHGLSRQIKLFEKPSPEEQGILRSSKDYFTQTIKYCLR